MTDRHRVTPLRPRDQMKTQAHMRAVATGVTIKPHETDSEKCHIELELMSVNGVTVNMAKWLKEMVYNGDGKEKPPVLEINLLHRTGEGVVAGPSRVVGVNVRTSEDGDDED